MTLATLRRWIKLCFFLSGLTGLVYQIAWTRMLGLIFGSTLYSVTTVLSVFFAGLAIGAHFFGRFIDRRGTRKPLEVYGWLEIGIGLWGAIVPGLLHLIEVLYIERLHPLDLSFEMLTLLRFLFTFLVLLLPTTLMGGTLPVLVKFFVRRLEGVGEGIASLYFINTIGAMVGVGLCGFFLFQLVGVPGATWVAVGINLLVGGVAIWGNRALAASGERERPSPEGGEGVSVSPSSSEAAPVDPLCALFSPRPVPPFPTPQAILNAAFFSGLAALAYEVYFNRVLSIMLGDTVFVFSIILIVFLGGIALGSAVFRRRIDRLSHLEEWLALCQFVIGCSILLLTPFLDWLPVVYAGIMVALDHLFPQIHVNWVVVNLVKLMLCTFMLGIPTLHMGASFPILGRLYTRSLRHLGEEVGTVYQWNTVGGIFGSILAGFVALPLFGSRVSLVLTALVSIAIGLYFWKERLRRLSAAAFPPLLVLFAVVAAVLLHPWDVLRMHAQTFLHYVDFAAMTRGERGKQGGEGGREAAHREGGEVRHYGYRALYYSEGIHTNVLVSGKGKNLQIHVGSKVQASTYFDDLINQYLLGHLPTLLHPAPRTGLITGLGAGIALGSMARHDSYRVIDVAEISANVIPAARLFGEFNGNVLDDPRVTIHLGDGRNYILATRTIYDVISTDAFEPYQANAAGFYTYDYMSACRRKLSKDGVFCLWLPLTTLPVAYNKVIIHSLEAAFPHMSVWALGPQCLLIGTMQPLRLDVAALERRFLSPAVQRELAPMGLVRIETFLAYLSLTEKESERLVQGVSLNTDDHPILELSASRNLTRPTIGENQAFLAEVRRSAGMKRRLRELLVPPPDDPTFWERMDRAYEMVTILLDALAKANMGDPEGAQRDFERAFAIDGTDPYLRKTYEDALLRIFDHYMERGETEKIEILKERSRRLLGDR